MHERKLGSVYLAGAALLFVHVALMAFTDVPAWAAALLAFAIALVVPIALLSCVLIAIGNWTKGKRAVVFLCALALWGLLWASLGAHIYPGRCVVTSGEESKTARTYFREALVGRESNQ